MNITQWINDKLALAEKATKGPWKDKPSIHRGSEYRYVEIDEAENYTTLELLPEDAKAIADSRTTTPKTLKMLLVAVEALEEIKNTKGYSEPTTCLKLPKKAATALKEIEQLKES